jgi:hypothetical protein
MKPEEYKTVATRLAEILRGAPKASELAPPKSPVSDISGRWEVDVQFPLGNARHQLFLEVRGNEVLGAHVGTSRTGNVRGGIDGDQVTLRSALRAGGDNLSYTFLGRVSGDQMSGELDLAEHPRARWSARRYEYGRPSRRDPSA